MKKLFLGMAVIGSSVAVLGGCANSSKTEHTTAETTDIVASQTLEKTTSDNEKIMTYESGDYKWDISFEDVVIDDKYSIIMMGGEESIKLPNDNDTKFVLVDMTVQNKGKDSSYFGGGNYTRITLIYDNKYEYNPSLVTDHINDDGIVLEYLPVGPDGISVDPLVEKKMKVIFNVPLEVINSDKPLALKIHDGSNEKDNGMTYQIR